MPVTMHPTIADVTRVEYRLDSKTMSIVTNSREPLRPYSSCGPDDKFLCNPAVARYVADLLAMLGGKSVKVQHDTENKRVFYNLE